MRPHHPTSSIPHTNYSSKPSLGGEREGRGGGGASRSCPNPSEPRRREPSPHEVLTALSSASFSCSPERGGESQTFRCSRYTSVLSADSKFYCSCFDLINNYFIFRFYWDRLHAAVFSDSTRRGIKTTCGQQHHPTLGGFSFNLVSTKFI